jgi:chromosome partitioning protein
MKTVAIISQKGGVGKTTLALHLAVAAERDGKTTVIIDLDPQASAATWKDLRSAIGSSIELARLAKKPFAVVVNAVPPRGALGSEADAAISTYDAPIAPVHLSMRAAYYHCLVNGQVAQEYEPTGKAGEEAFKLYKWVRKQVGM